ncbi:hypothetical protein CapIbe_008588 [Capra ibex]
MTTLKIQGSVNLTAEGCDILMSTTLLKKISLWKTRFSKAARVNILFSRCKQVWYIAAKVKGMHEHRTE